MIHNRQLFSQADKHVLPAFMDLPMTARASRPAAAATAKAPSLPILDEPRKDYALAAAYAYCERMARRQSENVPVASRFVPAELRPHLLSIYAFRRAADDFTDEPAYRDRRHSALDQWEHELFRTFHGEANHPVFVALRHTVEACDLPLQPFSDLLTGFRMDMDGRPFTTFEELRTYCRHASEPLGHLVLWVFGYRDPALHAFASDLCTGLQLATFLQDLGQDVLARRHRIPLEDLYHFGIPVEIGGPEAGTSAWAVPPRAWRDLLRFQAARARALLERGRPLLERVGADLAMELCLTWHSGQAILDKIETLGEGILHTRPSLGRADRAKVLARALGTQLPQLARSSLRRGEAE